MKEYVCPLCGYIYDPAAGDIDEGIPPGTPFEKLPGGWGVTMDDIAAAVYANIFTHAVVWAIVNYWKV